ncbi:MAG: PKD domain-containing protein, partial [Thermoplasmata archaeon]|nr:PKD domain-containing protein [Thermoplasmata archaeon]
DYGDTWTFLHGNWTQLTPASHPSARWASAMTWDGADNEMVLFGGCAGSAVGDTWTFVGGNWTQVSPTSAPSARENVALRYDAADSQVILFGGDDYYSATYSDTWAFHANNWTQLNETVHPSARSMASFTYDVALSSLVLFGGSGSQTFGDTWLFAGDLWTLTHPTDSPLPRFFGEMAYDPTTAQAVLWGGAGGVGDLTDTWVYAGVNLTANDSASYATGSIRVGFSATAVGGSGTISYLWQFGDGNVSTEPATSNFYGTPGRYMATVWASDANGSSASASFFVRVIAPLAASAQAFPTTGVVPLTVQCSFAASGGSAPYHVLWTAGAGSNSSTSETTSFVYGASGTFTATVNVTDSAGATWNDTFTIVAQPLVIAPLVSGVVASATDGAAPLQVWFSSSMSGGVLPYTTSWAFGDGSTGTGTAVNHTFTSPGELTTTFTVIDARGILHTSSVNLSIGPGLSASGTAPPSAVANSSVSFSGSVNGGEAPYTAVWDFGDSHAAAAIDTTHAYSSAGTYVATFTVVDHRGISVSQQFHVTVSAAAANTNQSTHPSTNSGSSSSVGADTAVLALAVLGGAAMIAIAIVVVRRMDR